MSFWRFILVLSIVCLIIPDSVSDTLDTYKVKLLLDRTEYIEGDTILLTIEFDFNRGDSVAYYYTLDFLFGIILSDEKAQEFRVLQYFLSRHVLIASQEISVRPNEVKRILTNLNCEFTSEEKFRTFDNRCLVNLSPGIYKVSFYESRIVRLYGKNVSANTLTFKVLPKEK